MREYKVQFYEKENGEVPVEEFLLNLDTKMRAKLTGLIAILQEYGNQLREPYSKPLGDGILSCEEKIKKVPDLDFPLQKKSFVPTMKILM